MANLLDTIKQNREQLAGQQAPMTDQTQKIQTLMRAKSGKAIGSGEAAASSLGEQSAVQQTQDQLGQLGQNLQIQQKADETAQKAQDQQTQQARSDITQATRFNTVQNQMKANQILNDLSQQKGELDLDKDRARLEQASFILAMGDKQYTDELQQIGQRRRLDNEADFNQEMQQLAFGNNLDLLKSKLASGDILAASDREFNKAMSKLSIEDAIKIAQTEMQYGAAGAAIERDAIDYQAEQQARAGAGAQQAQALGGLLSGGLQAASSLSQKKGS